MIQGEERSRQGLHHKIDVREQLLVDPLGRDAPGLGVPITGNATIGEFMNLRDRIRNATVWLGLPDWSAPDWSSLANDIEAQMPSLQRAESEEQTNAKEISELRVELRQLKRVIDKHIARDT
jgi:hypothetical protein